MYTKKLLNIFDFENDPDKAKSFYQSNGFLICNNVFEKSECEAAIQESKNFENYKLKNFIPEIMPHRKNSFFLKMMKNKKLRKILDYIMSSKEEIFGLQSTFFYGIPGTTGSSPHQDSLYVKPENYDDFISAWIALADVEDEDMGNLIIYPKSHLFGSLPIKENDTKNSKYQNDGLVKFESVMKNMNSFNQIKIKVKAGSAVIMHSNLIHRSIDNNSEKNRHSLLLTYIKDKCNFREGYEAKRKKIPLHN